MHKPISRLWFLGPPFAILVSLLVYYAKFANVRNWIDARFPWVAENVGTRLPSLDATPAPPPANRAREARPAESPADAPPEPPPPVAPPKPPSFIGPDGNVDLERLSASRPDWPKTVKLRKTTEFPAVVNGKVVGKIAVPAGTEATLQSIQQGKLGLEYQGGGAWMAVDETDLKERLAR